MTSLRVPIALWWILPLAASALMAFSCAVERPGVSDESYERPTFKHAALTQSCATCHEVHRPGPDDDGRAHGGGGDCGTCHKPSDHREGWLPPLFFSHDPMPESCVACHAKDRPRPPHPETGDCASCHRFPAWK